MRERKKKLYGVQIEEKREEQAELSEMSSDVREERESVLIVDAGGVRSCINRRCERGERSKQQRVQM